MKKKFLVIISILLISLLACLVYMTQFYSTTGLDRKEEKIIKHGFRLLEEQIGTYIKENYSGISKIEFSPIFIQGGKDNPPFTADVLPVIYDEEGNRAVLGGQIGKTGYPSYGILSGLLLNFDNNDNEIIELENSAKGLGVEIDVSNAKTLPEEAKLTPPIKGTDDNIDALVNDGQLKDVIKSDVGSPKAKKNYNLENPNFSDKGYAKALDMVKELYDEGYFNKDANSTTWEMSQTMVQEGTAGMVYEEVQNLKNYNTALGEDGWGYFYLPEIENGAGEKGYITGGPDEFMINSESKHPDEAIKFLKYLTSDEVQAKMCYDLSFFPVTNVKLDGSKMVPGSEEIIAHNLKAPGMSEWLDCVLNQTVADTYLEGCQTIFQDDTGESIMKKVSATATEVKADK